MGWPVPRGLSRRSRSDRLETSQRKAGTEVKILLVGAGGVGGAFAAIAARRDFFEQIVIADYDPARADKAAAADDRYVAFAKAFDFNTYGAFTTTLPAATTDTTAAYLRQSLETDAGSEDAGVRLALYFARMAPTVSSGYGVLGDPALSQVVKTVLGLPDSSSADGIAGQAVWVAHDGKRIFRGARLAMNTTLRPTSASGSP